MEDTSQSPPEQTDFLPKCNVLPKDLTWEKVETLYTINNVYFLTFGDILVTNS